ncbi:uncharacterized protein LOC127879194 [Dreissena polymorpha]|uniref:uncharacterized protein LOC127879194 n=1 Tax=Dreissena polymorpha TaxID=45954 RepID=UPI002263C399|nr:uncharacterized protein LOC127879194 [Dreissena polymorpha]
MKLLFIGLMAAMLVWGPQTRAQKDDLTNDEVQEAETRANNPSVGAADKKICDGVCAEFEGDDLELEKCIEECELKKNGVDSGDDQRSPKRKKWVRRVRRVNLIRIWV